MFLLYLFRGIPALLTLAFVLSTASVAQEFPDHIVGCLEVDCPVLEDSVFTDCMVVDFDLALMGLARIPFPSNSSLSGLSWVEGVGAEMVDVDGAEGQMQRSETRFWLGTPPDLDLDDVGACALFFTQLTDAVTFDNQIQVSVDRGDCDEALSENCVSALNERALALDFHNLTIDDACQLLQSEFEDNLDEACHAFTSGPVWNNLVVRPLSGPGSPSPITAEQNSTSNCWPIIPRSDQLTPIETFEDIGDVFASTLNDWSYTIYPILTVFFPGNGTLITEVESQLTCMKAIDGNSARNATMSPGDEGSATSLKWSAALMLGMFFLTLFLA
ncbi:hypothetical protein S40285_10328 [Stachybotrys chlorohalonatus IBT 40285]|uniref:Uncharacterized protein n=1 Tax=Stachybotrys chlorohalonatus (strain IBT 40285) TaxID=1283841 RepID=A0A084QM58_STAC4|nr:hypothetical protein S40285_10328 [Stachybotrys chlorohalonata IBT 40285]